MARYTLVVFMLLTFLSCSNLTLQEDTLDINTIQEGAQFRSGDSINIEIDNTGASQPRTMDIEVVYIDNYSRAISDDFYLSDSIDLNEYPNAQLYIDETFPEGLYKLYVTVLDSDEVVIDSDEKEFSVYSGSIYSSVSSILPTNGVYTDSKVLLISDIVSNNIDPFIIWSYDSEIISQGYLSEGYNTIVWNSSDNLGFNEVKMEVYPYRFSSYIESQDFNLFSTVVSSREMDLFESDNYYRAFLFNGNLLDEMNKNTPVTTYGDFTPMAMDSFYGLEFNSGSGFISNSSLIPSKNGSYENFSLVVDIVHNGLEDSIILEDEIDGLVSRLFNEDGDVYYTLEDSSSEVGRIKLYPIGLNSPEKIVISYLFNSDETVVYGYSSGVLFDQFSFPTPTPLGESGSLTLGDLDERGDSSFTIDSLMVYYRDNLGENNIYVNHFSDRSSSLGIIGDGFYSMTKPVNVNGNWNSNGEVLFLNPDSTIDLSYYIEGFTNYTLEMELYSSSNYQLLSRDDPDIIFDLYSDLEIKKRGDIYYVNGDQSLGLLNGLYLRAVDNLAIDEVRVLSRESLEE